jgi:PAS domain S-box-containing protein
MDDGNATAALYRKIGEASADAIIFADRAGLVRLWNRGAELIFGYPAAEAIGQSLDIIIPERLRDAHWRAFDQSLQSGEAKYTDRVLTTRSMHKNGSRLYVDLSFGLVKDENGHPLGAFAIGRDCTARYLADGAQKTRIATLEARLTGAPAQD